MTSSAMQTLTFVILAGAAVLEAYATNYCGCHVEFPYGNGPRSRQRWGDFDIHTNYYEVTPDTGRIVEVTFLEMASLS
jgi:hypothetical protein